NFVIDMAWNDGKLSEGQILSRSGGDLVIRSATPFVIQNDLDEIRSAPDADIKGYHLAKVETVAGKTYGIEGQK
ncbi:MAG: glycoside hydrolase family 95-like protein, partial [Planctomycetota bacterium]